MFPLLRLFCFSLPFIFRPTVLEDLTSHPKPPSPSLPLKKSAQYFDSEGMYLRGDSRLYSRASLELDTNTFPAIYNTGATVSHPSFPPSLFPQTRPSLLTKPKPSQQSSAFCSARTRRSTASTSPSPQTPPTPRRPDRPPRRPTPTTAHSRCTRPLTA